MWVAHSSGPAFWKWWKSGRGGAWGVSRRRRMYPSWEVMDLFETVLQRRILSEQHSLYAVLLGLLKVGTV